MDEGQQIVKNKMCRTCLSKLYDATTYDLFVVPGLAKKLCVCTSLTVEQQDCYPRNICANCYNRLNDLYDFQKQCVDSIAKLKDLMVNNHCNRLVENYDILSVAPHDIDVAIDDEDRLYFDPLLSAKVEAMENEEAVFKMLEVVDKETEEAHQMDTSSEGEDDYNNSADPYDFLPMSQLRCTTPVSAEDSSSADVEARDINASQRKTAVRKLTNLIDCHICHQKFKKEIRYDEHMKHHNDLLPFQCTVETCKKGFTTAAGLRHHVDHAHSELCKLHACTVDGCDKSFPRTRMLTHHLKKIHSVSKPEIRDHPCTECDKVFRCPTALKKHMYKHTGEELPICCNICSKRFHINSELRDHLLRHAGVKNHVCPYCGVGKTTRQEWNKHILTHTKEKQFQCRQCDHSSHNKQALTNHVKVVHMKIKNFACQYCGKTFGKSHACKIHERLHTGENCCECKICGKIFLFEKRLTKHLKIHEMREIAEKKHKDADGGSSRSDFKTDQAAAVPEAVRSLTIASPTKAKKTHRVERVDITQLAGTSVNPISSVSVPSWSPQMNFIKKEGQHICPGCGRGFNHIGNMKLHYKVIHEKIKDFACRFCPKRFGKAQYLRHHEYTHTGERPYGCKICDKHFSHGSSLRKHMISHNRPPKNPKAPKDTVQKTDNQRPKIELSKRPPKIYEQYQDPAAERAAATAALLAQKLEESEAQRRVEAKTRRIQEAACKELQKLQKDGLAEKVSYERLQLEKSKLDITEDGIEINTS